MPQPTQLTSSATAYQELALEIKENSCTIRGELRTDDLGSAESLYVHVPFCFHKCHYCDFYSIVDSRDRQSAFTARLICELRASQTMMSVPIRTIFVGGGTPTLLDPSLWRELGDAFHNHVTLADDAEFTVEANPETVTPELADALVAAGINRVSIGAQSFDERHLKTLERQHDPSNVERSMAVFRAAGVTNINLDLIFAIPGQTLADWQRDLERIFELQPTHVSCYGLTYEPNTAMTQRLKAGQFERADDSLEAEMYELAMDRLAEAGYEQYEISNWSLSAPAGASMRCQHNLAYWTNANWWPIGPSASGHMNGVRWKNVPRLGEYLDADSPDGLPPVVDVERVDDDSRAGEELMLRLRLLDGIPHARLDALLSESPCGEARRKAIARHIDDKLLVSDERGVRFTRRGLLLADSVLSDLV